MHQSCINKYSQGGLWSALLVLLLMVGCGEENVAPRIKDPNTIPTQTSENLISQESKDGTQTYRMETPLMEYYELADEPFTEFTQGIKIETFNDSTAMIESDLRADYAYLDENKELWVARGNVVANNYSGDRKLYTDELWWDQKKKIIYADVPVRVVEGKSAHIGMGFEADEQFTRWSFRRPRGQMEVQRDTTSRKSVSDSLPADSLRMGDNLPVHNYTPISTSRSSSSRAVSTRERVH